VNINAYLLEVIIEVAGYFKHVIYFFTEFNTIKMQFILNLV